MNPMTLSRQRIATLRAIQARKREYALVSSLTTSSNHRHPNSDSSDLEDYYYYNQEDEDDESSSSDDDADEQEDHGRDFAYSSSSLVDGNPDGTSVTSSNNERKQVKKVESIISDGKYHSEAASANNSKATTRTTTGHYIHPSETDETRDVILNYPSPPENSIHNQVIREFWERYEISSHNYKNKVCRQAIAEMIRRGVRFLCSKDYANRASSGRRKSEDLVEIDPFQSHRVLLRVTRALRKEVLDRIQQMKPKQRQEHEEKMEALREKERQTTITTETESDALFFSASNPISTTTTGNFTTKQSSYKHHKHSSV
jgi:hypothetical protein